MILNNIKAFLCFVVFALSLNTVYAGGDEKSSEEFNASEFIIHHVLDSHDWHVADIGETPISIPLPIILWDGGLKVFMSSAFEHGHKVVEKDGSFYKIYHEKIYKTDASGTLGMDEDGHPTNEKPLDFSITKNVASMLIAAFTILFLFIVSARSYVKKVPSGIGKFLEPLVVFVKDDIAIPNIGEKKYKKFLPYLLTIFFFIWVNNIFGLLPFPPGSGANVSGNISFTLTLSFFTLLLTVVFGNKHFWQHVLWMPGVPIAVRPLLTIVEVIGIFTKPFALMIRLFANITAGHILILSLVSLIFLFQSYLVAPVSLAVVLFMFCIELLVAALQAYIFTLLTALFIGQAVADHDEH